MIHFVVPAGHARMMREYLELWGKPVADRLHVVCAESLPAATHVSPGTYVLAALDQYSPAMAAFITAFRGAFAGRDDVRFLNHPTDTLQRFALLDALYSRALNSYRVMHVTGNLHELRYPVFVRDERNHDGALSRLLRTQGELEAAIGRVLVQGRSARNLMVVEFCETADADGYYRKYSSFIVGDRIIPRSLSYSRTWMLKFQGSEFSPRMAHEELEYMLSNPHEDALRDLFALARVDYGRIDYAVKEGRIETWEINLNPTIGRGLRPSSGKVPPEVEAIRKPGREHFYKLFREAWESVDLAAPAGDPIPLAIDDRVTAAALADDAVKADWLATVRRVLRPALPIIEPVVKRVLPVLGRAAMRWSPS